MHVGNVLAQIVQGAAADSDHITGITVTGIDGIDCMLIGMEAFCLQNDQIMYGNHLADQLTGCLVGILVTNDAGLDILEAALLDDFGQLENCAALDQNRLCGNGMGTTAITGSAESGKINNHWY